APHATRAIYTLSLHDALPIYRGEVFRLGGDFLGLHGLQERDQCEDEFLERGQVDGGGRSHEVGQAAENDVVMFLFLIRRLSAFQDRKSTRLNSSHVAISYAVF